MKWLFIFLLFIAPLNAQIISTGYNANPPPLQYPGWTYGQEVYTGGNQGGGFSPCAAGTTCTMNYFNKTANSARAVMVLTTNNVTISSVCTAATSSGCSGSSDGWTLCPASSCHKNQSANIDMAYTVTGGTSNNFLTVTLSGASGAKFFVMFAEVNVPAGFTPAFDNSATASSASCTSCTLAAPTITGTDAVIHFPVSGSGSIGPTPINVFTNPWFQDYNGIVFGLNVTSGTTVPSYTQASAAFQDAAIAFKTTSSFTADSKNTFYQLVSMTTNNALLCNPTCTLTLSQTTGTGNLLFVAADTSTGGSISSISNGGTWATPPSGANTCQIILTGNANDILSCDYNLSSTATSSLSITMTSSTSYGFSVWEYSRASGSFVLDTQGSQNDTTCTSCVGPTLTLSGTNDIIFQMTHCGGGCNANTLYPIASNTGANGPAISLNSSGVALANTNSGTAITWGDTNIAVSTAAVAFK